MPNTRAFAKYDNGAVMLKTMTTTEAAYVCVICAY